MAAKNSVTGKEKHQGWVASLSDGSTVFEEPPVPGERTSWGKLQERCKKDGLWVTQIQLQRHGQNIVGIQKAAGYAAFMDYRKEGMMGTQSRTAHYYGIGSVVGEMVYCTIMNEQGQFWQDTRQLASMRAHCIMKPTEEAS